MKQETAIVHLGRETASAVRAVNPPLVRASTIVSDSLATFKKGYGEKVFDSLRYGRSGTATTFELQRMMAALEETEGCIATTSGLSAIVAVLATFSGPGRHVLVSDGVYGPTRAYCEKVLVPAGTDVEFYGPADDIKARIRTDTSLIFVESPASLTMEMYDIRQICAVAKSAGIPVAADATWGTPVFFRAHALGIDLSIHAATKYINGHSDLLLGLITGTNDALEKVRAQCDLNGTHAAPDACWLTLRGIRTLSVRMRQHQASAMELAEWLQNRPEVRRVLFPALDTDPGHDLWRNQFSGAAGPFTIELTKCDEASFARFIDSLKLFALGTSWGGFESLVMPAIPHHLRNAEQADEGRLVRLHIGLESPDDLRADLEVAFAAMTGTL
jgi:cysteine-S-conjugate beta-lyase